MYDLDKENEMAGKVSLEDFGTMDLRKWLVIGCLVVSLIVIIYGSIAPGMGSAGVFRRVPLVLAVVSGAVAGFSPQPDFQGICGGLQGHDERGHHHRTGPEASAPSWPTEPL